MTVAEIRVSNVAVLGELDITVKGVRHDIPSGNRVRALWACLVLEPQRVVPVEVLIEAVWGSAPPRRARESVHVYISQLRVFAQNCGADPGLIETKNGGYRLAVNRDLVDWCRVLANLDEARELHRRQHAEDALTVLDMVAADFHRPILGGVRGGAKLGAFVQKMEEIDLSAIELRNEVLLTMGDAQTVVSDLQALVYEYPVRENLHGQLMRALFHTGRQIEALEVYSKLREELRSGFGVEPGSDVREIHRRILTAQPMRTNAQLV